MSIGTSKKLSKCEKRPPEPSWGWAGCQLCSLCENIFWVPTYSRAKQSVRKAQPVLCVLSMGPSHSSGLCGRHRLCFKKKEINRVCESMKGRKAWRERKRNSEVMEFVWFKWAHIYIDVWLPGPFSAHTGVGLFKPRCSTCHFSLLRFHVASVGLSVKWHTLTLSLLVGLKMRLSHIP